MIDWITFLTSIGGSAIIFAGFGYFFKKIFESTIQIRLQEFSERNKIKIQEAVRREAFIFDDQYQTLKQMLTLIYKSRNKTREFLNVINEPRKFILLIKDIENELNELSSIGYSVRAVCPDSIFILVHDYKNTIRAFFVTASKLTFSNSEETTTIAPNNERNERNIEYLQNHYCEINRLYEAITQEIHNYLGIKDL